jgi:non-specific serine/threonine protein kinase
VAVSTLHRVGNLPVDMTSFVGRRHEVAEVKRLLTASRLVTLTGVGGVGKTRLALRVANEVQRAFPDGVWLVELAALGDPGLVAQTVASALDIRDLSTRRPVTVLTDHLADTQLLLVLDNCEHLLDACAAVADALLRACPGLRILTTSRQALSIAGEHIFTVPPLSVPDANVPSPAEALAHYEAVTLLIERAAAIAPGFSVTQENHVAVARLCAQLDGIPLAIELAAARLRSLSVDQVAERLESRYRLLTGGSRAAPPRHQTLRALIDWSYELCSEQEKRLWARMSVFAGGFDLMAAESICAGEELNADAILEVVDHLVAKSVLFSEMQDGRVRYRLLETIRQYGRERLTESGQEAGLRLRHRDFYLRLAQQSVSEWCGPGQEAWLARLRIEHDNLRAALDFCMTDPAETQAGLDLASALRFHWIAAASSVRDGAGWTRCWRLPAIPLWHEPMRSGSTRGWRRCRVTSLWRPPGWRRAARWPSSWTMPTPRPTSHTCPAASRSSAGSC